MVYLRFQVMGSLYFETLFGPQVLSQSFPLFFVGWGIHLREEHGIEVPWLL